MANSPFPIMQLANAAGQVIDPATGAAAAPAPVTFPTGAKTVSGVMQPSAGTFIDQERMLVPGQSFGHYIGGAGGGLAATGRFGQAWFWFEEDVN